MKLLALLLCLGLPLVAEAKPLAESAPKTTGAFVALSVADLAASTAWYRDKLGLEIVLEIPSQGGIAVTVLEGNGLIVELIQNSQARPLSSACPGVTDPQLVLGFYKAGFLVKDFDRTLAQLQERGVEIAFGPFPATDTQRANAIIRDNSGNLLQLFGD